MNLDERLRLLEAAGINPDLAWSVCWHDYERRCGTDRRQVDRGTPDRRENVEPVREWDAADYIDDEADRLNDLERDDG